MMDRKPDSFFRTIDGWISRPVGSACLTGFAMILILVLLTIAARPAGNIWIWMMAGLGVAFAAWAGYRHGLQRQKLKAEKNKLATAESETLSFRGKLLSSQSVIDRIDAIFFALDSDLLVTYWNRQSDDLLQNPGTMAIGKPLPALIPEDLAGQLQEICADALQLQQPQVRQVEIPQLRPSAIFQIGVFPSENGVSVLMNDVSEDVIHRQETQDTAEKYQEIFEEASDAIFVYDPGLGRIVDVNAKMCAMSGYARETLLRMSASDLLSTDSHFTMQALRRKVMKTLSDGPQFFEWLAKDAYGRLFWVEIGFKHITIKGHSRLMGVVRNITEYKRTAGELNSLATKLRVIGRSARNMTAQLDMQALAEQVVDSLVEATSCYSANVFIADGGLYRWAAGEGGDLDEVSPKDLTFAPGQGLIGSCVQFGDPILVPDVLVDERYFKWEGFPETRSELVFPVKSNDRVLAVVDLQSTEASAFDNTDVEAVGVLADQMAVAAENIKLFQDTRRWAHEMEMLVQITTDLRAALTRGEVVPIVLESLVKLFRADGALMSIKDMLTGDQIVELGRGAWIVLSGRRFPAGKGPIGKVGSEGKSIIINDLPNANLEGTKRLVAGLQAMACVPLISQEQVIGTMAIGRNTPLAEDEFHILETIADIVASAIQRANLFDQTERRLHQVQSLRTIDMAITADMSLRMTLHIILDQVMVQLRIDAADILLFQPDSQLLKYTAGLGFRSRNVPQQTYHLGDELGGKVAQDGHTLSVLNFLAEDAAYKRSAFLAEEGILSYFGLPMFAKGQLMGVLEIFHRSPINPEYEWLQLMEALSVQAAIAINNSELFEQLQQSNQELMQAYDTTLEGWARALELRDRETEGHSRRVTTMTVHLARRMGFSEEQLVHVRRGALLHDIGKMGIPDSILFKPGLLDEKEWDLMRQHPVHAYQLLAPIAYLKPALEIPYSHHERWDGTGYPQKLKGEQIPLAARIFSVVDVWDALISDRPYQKAWEEPKIRKYIQELADKQLDPNVVKAFFEMIDQPDDDESVKMAASGSAGKLQQ